MDAEREERASDRLAELLGWPADVGRWPAELPGWPADALSYCLYYCDAQLFWNFARVRAKRARRSRVPQREIFEYP